MGRKDFAQILQDNNIDINREYARLHNLFYLQSSQDYFGNYFTLEQICDVHFTDMPLRGTCISLEDYNTCYGFNFKREMVVSDIDGLILFCEYTYNLLKYCNIEGPMPSMLVKSKEFFAQQIKKVMDLIGYMPSQKDDITIFVPKSVAAIEVTKTIPDNMSYKVIEYNHHSLKGDLEGKKAILLMLAERLESNQDVLSKINNTLKTSIFFAFNNLNIRHNNCDSESNHYWEYLANMTEQELEQWYDDTYQLCLLAFLELDNVDRKKRFEELKKERKNKG